LGFEIKRVYTLPRGSRLKRQEGFSKILKQHAEHNQWFAVHYSPNSVGYTRLGMSISKKYVNSAVSRNQIKRMVRECFRLLEVRKSFAQDVVIRLRKPLHENDRASAQCVLSVTLSLVLMEK
jgi:ribonuclease P protein component